MSFVTSFIDPAQISAGKITLAGRSAGIIIIQFHATGYFDAVVTQTVIEPTAEVRVKSTDSNTVEVEEARALVFVDKNAIVGNIGSKLISLNGTIQMYKFVYSSGDEMKEYGLGDKINPNHSVALHVTAADDSTIGYYTVLVNP
ncbi:hypothetical protein [Psychrobacillus sp.]|uniref:hypothetical protein n=1 Tax=Psychrobacillus sp. TaxID=1871623 RepID=UPI0028BE20F1|nr:hypothetical protein [Psychrobacillus sp.]